MLKIDNLFKQKNIELRSEYGS